MWFELTITGNTWRRGFSVTQRDFTLTSRWRHLPVDMSDRAPRIHYLCLENLSLSSLELLLIIRKSCCRLHTTTQRGKERSTDIMQPWLPTGLQRLEMLGQSMISPFGHYYVLLHFSSRRNCSAACAACQVGWYASAGFDMLRSR